MSGLLDVMTTWHLAQLNIGRARGPLDGPGAMADFVARLDEINALADSSPGFVWRLVGETGANAIELRPYGPDVLINLSVWESVEALYEFAYRSAHLDVLRRRREYFDHDGLAAYAVLWWIPAGTVPSPEDAYRRLGMLAERGATAEAFTFRDRFPPPPSEAAA